MNSLQKQIEACEEKLENLYDDMKNGEIFFEFGKEEIEELR